MKICFIICTNSDLWFSECRKYIENLIIPENVEVEITGIRNATGMAEGYALGSSQSNADYKVYLHQDTFIINRHFIEDIDRIFRSDNRIGIIGMIGSNDVEEQKISWCNWECGKVIGCNGYQEMELDCGDIAEAYQVVDCLDGMILVTRYNVPWREDVFKGWHFYDRSICMEYRRKGYICVVPRQTTAWCIHDCGFSDLIGWSDGAIAFLREYKDFFQEEHVLRNIEMPDERERLQLGKIAADIELLVNNRKMKDAVSFLQEIDKTGVMPNKKIVFLYILLEIWMTEQKRMFFAAGDSVADMKQKYTQGSFLLRRKLYGLWQDEKDILFLSKFTDEEKKIILWHELTLHNLEQDDK